MSDVPARPETTATSALSGEDDLPGFVLEFKDILGV
jgi:hypothetical protein